MSDPLSKKKFLIVTGFSVSVVPANTVHLLLTPTNYLFAANNSTLSQGLRREYVWCFKVADVIQPILGAEFLSHDGILVDLKDQRLHDPSTHLSVLVTLKVGQSNHISSIKPLSCFADVIKEVPSLSQQHSALRPLKHTVAHHISTTGRPNHANPLCLGPERYRTVKEEFDDFLQQGIIRPSSSFRSSALHVVPRKMESYVPAETIELLMLKQL
ncbi:uncharacterized protein [Lepeophtheirus salmonis]|uniref:uncharacterized protein n=1 Tax=Lepeophtheirus salmonis TaxID=72036 RepID=UPI001AE9FD3C|nr:uncharacterized protein LOC121123573 [Lepeophtheirus salmonis]